MKQINLFISWIFGFETMSAVRAQSESCNACLKRKSNHKSKIIIAKQQQENRRENHFTRNRSNFVPVKWVHLVLCFWVCFDEGFCERFFLFFSPYDDVDLKLKRPVALLALSPQPTYRPKTMQKKKEKEKGSSSPACLISFSLLFICRT